MTTIPTSDNFLFSNATTRVHIVSVGGFIPCQFFFIASPGGYRTIPVYCFDQRERRCFTSGLWSVPISLFIAANCEKWFRQKVKLYCKLVKCLEFLLNDILTLCMPTVFYSLDTSYYFLITNPMLAGKINSLFIELKRAISEITPYSVPCSVSRVPYVLTKDFDNVTCTYGW